MLHQPYYSQENLGRFFLAKLSRSVKICINWKKGSLLSNIPHYYMPLSFCYSLRFEDIKLFFFFILSFFIYFSFLKWGMDRECYFAHITLLSSFFTSESKWFLSWVKRAKAGSFFTPFRSSSWGSTSVVASCRGTMWDQNRNLAFHSANMNM